MLQHTIWPFCISPVARVQKPACLAATSALSPSGLFLALSGFSTSMDIIRKDQTKHMDSGLHWGHGGRFTMERNSSGPVQFQAYRQMEWMCSGWGVGSPVYNWAPWLTGLKLRLCVWSIGLSVMFPDIQIWLRGKEAACWWEQMCLLAPCNRENTRTAQIPKSASFVLLPFEEMPVAKWQPFPGGTEGESKI